MAYSDGRAVDVVAPLDVNKDDFLHVDGWNGVALESKLSGERLAMEVASDRLHWITLPENITGVQRGEIIYVDVDGALTLTPGTNMPALKVWEAEDANFVVGARILNVDVPPTAGD